MSWEVSWSEDPIHVQTEEGVVGVPNEESCWSAKRGKRDSNQRSCLDKWQGLSWEVDWFANPIHAQTEEPGVGAPKEEKETQIKGEQMWTCWIIGLVGGLD